MLFLMLHALYILLSYFPLILRCDPQHHALTPNAVDLQHFQFQALLDHAAGMFLFVLLPADGFPFGSNETLASLKHSQCFFASTTQLLLHKQFQGALDALAITLNHNRDVELVRMLPLDIDLLLFAARDAKLIDVIVLGCESGQGECWGAILAVFPLRVFACASHPGNMWVEFDAQRPLICRVIVRIAQVAARATNHTREGYTVEHNRTANSACPLAALAR